MATNLLASLSIQELRRAIAIKEQIATLESELNHILGTPTAMTPVPKRGGRKRMSTAARTRISAAQKARWPRPYRKPATARASKVRRKLSAKARARLSMIAEARWARAKAAGKKSL